MSIEDDLAEQERWERMPTAYKRKTPAPCPDLVSERTKLELLTIDDWLKKLAEKEAMIDWLTSMQNWDIDEDAPTRCPQFRQPPNDCTIVNHNCAKCWYEAAQEAVKKDA